MRPPYAGIVRRASEVVFLNACKLLIVLSLVLLLVACGFVVSITRTGTALMALADALDEELNQSSPKAGETLTEFLEIWTKVEPFWQCVTLHKDIETVNEQLEEVKNAMDTQAYDAASVSAALLKEAVAAILQKESLSLQNIL